MARPQRNTVDYFPFYCEDGEKMFYLEETYGNDGFATFIKLLRELAKTDYHFLNLSKPSTKMFLSAKCKISKEILESIINDLVELGKFDKTLWKENSIVWCQDFIDSIQDAYLRRNNNCITYEGLLQHLISLGIRKQVKCKPKVDVNTQTKLKDSKEDEIKEDDIDTAKPQYSVIETFDIFWEHYHKTLNKKKESKEPALKYWKKLSLEERRKAYNMAFNYSKTNEEKFLVKARTYLSDKRFNDEFEIIKQKEFDRYGNEKLDFGTGITKV